MNADVAAGREEVVRGLASRAYAGIILQFEYALYPSGLGDFLDVVATAGPPVVVTVHSVNLNGRRKREANRLLGELPAVFVVHSEAQLESLRLAGIPGAARAAGIPATAATAAIIPMGCPDLSSTFGPRAVVRREMGLGPAEFVVGFFGFAAAHKGIPNLIRALALLPGVRGYIAATTHPANPEAVDGIYEACGFPRLPPGRGDLGTERRDLCNVVMVHDYLPDRVFGRYQNAVDVIVLPYATRGSSVSASMLICEALASGRPVIATDIVYFSGLGHEVLRIPDSQPETIAAAIEAVRRDPGLAASLVMRARGYAREHSWAKVARRYLDALSGPGPLGAAVPWSAAVPWPAGVPRSRGGTPGGPPRRLPGGHRLTAPRLVT